MGKCKLTKEEIVARFSAGIDCGQVVAEQFETETGLTADQLRRMTACFAAGMMRGETCGAVVGAYNVIGLAYGHSEDQDEAQKGKMLEKMLRFNELFQEKYRGFTCKELLGADISTAEGGQKIGEQNLLLEFCPLLVSDVIEIVEQVLAE